MPGKVGNAPKTADIWSLTFDEKSPQKTVEGKKVSENSINTDTYEVSDNSAITERELSIYFEDETNRVEENRSSVWDLMLGRGEDVSKKTEGKGEDGSDVDQMTEEEFNRYFDEDSSPKANKEPSIWDQFFGDDE